MNIWMVSTIVLNLAMAVGLIFMFRALMGIFAGVDVTDELANKDNPAFGLAVAGGIGALCLVLGAAVGGEAAASLTNEAINVLSYGLAGIVLLKVGMLINDNIFLRGFSVAEQIRDKNVAVGVVQAANLLAVGIIVSSAVNWVEVETWQGIGGVVLVYFAGQIVLSAVTALRIAIYKSRHDGDSWQQAIAGGNTALAIRYAGQVIGTAIAASAMSAMVTYIASDVLMSSVYWLGMAVAAMLVVWALYRVCVFAILAGVDIVEEVDNQRNTAVAYIEASLFIGIAVILKAMLA